MVVLKLIQILLFNFYSLIFIKSSAIFFYYNIRKYNNNYKDQLVNMLKSMALETLIWYKPAAGEKFWGFMRVKALEAIW